MRCLTILLALAAFGVAGCNKPQPPLLQFYGHAPYYTKDKDSRFVQAFCPHCSKQIKWKTERCKHKIVVPQGESSTVRKCLGEIKWPETVPCPYCKGTNVCEVCAANKMKNFKCFQCKGVGYFPPNLPCSNCNGDRLCHSCKGKGACTFCASGKYVVETKKAVQEPEEVE
jgi:hypothetical protein